MTSRKLRAGADVIVAPYFASALALIMVACTPPPRPAPPVAGWAKASASYDDFLKDRYQCFLEARSQVSGAIRHPIRRRVLVGTRRQQVDFLSLYGHERMDQGRSERLQGAGWRNSSWPMRGHLKGGLE